MHRFSAILSLVLVLPACELIEEPHGQFYARFEDAGGLREGANVYVAGVRTGRVGIVRLDGDKARIDFTMDKNANVKIHDDACVSVGWYAGAGAHLVLRPGKKNRAELPTGSEILCVDETSQLTGQAVKKAIGILDDVASGKGTVGRLLRNEALADKVERFFDGRSAMPPTMVVAPRVSSSSSSAATPPAPPASPLPPSSARPAKPMSR